MEYNDAQPTNNLPLYGSLSLLSTTAVVLRLIARIKSKTTIGGDDWWACLGWVLLQAFIGVSIWVMKRKHDTENVELLIIIVQKAMYAAGPISISTITAAKISLILLYRRVFLPDKAFRVASNIVGALCLIWWISFVFTLLFQCTPVQRSWNREIPGTCFDKNAKFLGGEILNCVLDFAIIVLPVRVIRKLRLPLAQKITLCLIFIMGSFVSVISIIRMVLIYNADDEYHWYNQRQTNWLPIQLAMAIICCCLPTYRPLLPNGTAIMARLVGLYSSTGSLIPRKRSPAVSSTNGSRTIDDEPGTRSQHNFHNSLSGYGDKKGMSVLAHVVGAGVERVGDYVSETDYPMNAFNISKTVDLV